MTGNGRYQARIEPDLQAFIDRINALFPPETASLPLHEQRAVYDRMSAAFHAGRPPGISVRDETVHGKVHPVRVRRYAHEDGNASAAILYFHGGGFVFGGLDSHDDICAELCQSTGLETVSVDYRLAPEHPHPAAFDDAVAAMDWTISAIGRPVVLCGESAGGALAAALAHAGRERPDQPIGQVLIYPPLGGDPTSLSQLEHAHAPLLTSEDVAFYRRMRAGGGDFANDATFEPLRDDDFSGLPPTWVVTAQFDPLASDGALYAEAIRSAGGRARCVEVPLLVHGFLRARCSVGRARAAFDQVTEAIAMLARGAWRD
ncbi:MAG: alpha/beta hydrolase [Pseudomonadota bacterium]|nr:alpha/beta hydrolase [Pseudomonadota bacterium]